MQIFGEIPFIKPQNDTKNDDKLKKNIILFWLSFCSLFGAWKIVGMTVTCNLCDVMNIMWRKTEMELKS